MSPKCTNTLPLRPNFGNTIQIRPTFCLRAFCITPSRDPFYHKCALVNIQQYQWHVYGLNGAALCVWNNSATSCWPNTYVAFARKPNDFEYHTAVPMFIHTPHTCFSFVYASARARECLNFNHLIIGRLTVRWSHTWQTNAIAWCKKTKRKHALICQIERTIFYKKT